MREKIEYLEKYYNGNIDDAIKRLECGEPVQYIVGNVDFYGYILDVNKNVLIPRRETEELVEEVIKRSKNFDNPLIADIGTGSGAIAIALSKELKKTIYAVDISKEALSVANKNMLKNKADIKFYCGNMLDPIINNNIKLNIIISNPPYISYKEDIEDVVKNNEPHIALYANNNGLEYYDEILRNSKKVLLDKFLLAFEIGYKQKTEIIKLVNKYFKNVNVEVKKDLSNKDRMIFVYN